MVINDSGSLVTFKARDNNELISEIIMLVEEDDEFIVMSIEGEFTYKDMSKIINSIDSEKVINKIKVVSRKVCKRKSYSKIFWLIKKPKKYFGNNFFSV
jgi:hypothetical protein